MSSARFAKDKEMAAHLKNWASNAQPANAPWDVDVP